MNNGNWKSDPEDDLRKLIDKHNVNGRLSVAKLAQQEYISQKSKRLYIPAN